ncbi:MAG: hypothetical protein Q4D51_13605, partial [Eubacteriales bacterium]|nr:hypothetical protein [Eubacteriales bacterium]
YRKYGNQSQKTVDNSFEEVLRSSNTNSENVDQEKLNEKLAEWKEKVIAKILNGETEEKIQIGSQALTQTEWNEMLEHFDEAEEELRELVEEDIKEQEEKKMQENMGVTDSTNATETIGKTEEEIKMEMLTSESVAMECENESGDKELHIMWTTDEGMFCRKAGQESGYEWTIPFNSKEQRAKVEEILFSYKDDELPKEIVTKNFGDELFKKGLFD